MFLADSLLISSRSLFSNYSISANDLTGTQLGCILTFFFIHHIAAETHPRQYGTGSSSRKHLLSLRVHAPGQWYVPTAPSKANSAILSIPFRLNSCLVIPRLKPLQDPWLVQPAANHLALIAPFLVNMASKSSPNALAVVWVSQNMSWMKPAGLQL